MSAKPKRHYSQAVRLHDTIRLIEARRGITLDELVQETGVNRRTVHRDLAAIEDAGYPLVSEWRGARKVFTFITGFKYVPPISFTLQELMTLSLFRSQHEYLKGTPFHDDIESIARKINSVLPPRYAAHMERMAQGALPVLSGSRDYRRVAGPLGHLREALLYQYRVMLTYAARGRGQAEQYEVEPYTLVFHKGGLYLFGYARNRKGFRTFAVDRITGVDVGRERFEIPDDFNAGERLRSSFGIDDEPVMAVRVRFSPEVAESIRERAWHESQQITEEPDGGIVISFKAGGKMEILAWVLSFGAHAELLQPTGLRESIRQIIALLRDSYQV